MNPKVRYSFKNLSVWFRKPILALVASLFLVRVGAAEPEKPNIIYIMVDDLGYYDLGAYGQEKIKTPELDRMAEEGIRFTQAYSGHAVCAPARSVLMTGQHTGRTPIRDNKAVADGPRVRESVGGLRYSIADEVVTVAEVLKSAGYTTGMSGKWGLAEPGTDGVPNQQGFDEFFGYLNQKKAHNHWPSSLWDNQTQVDLPGEPRSWERFSHPHFTEHALDFLDAHAQDGPFFYYLAYTLPHWPLRMPEDDVAPYTDKDWPDKAKAYAAQVTLVDRDVGRILDRLEELDVADNTIVFFCADNGASSEWEGLFNSVGEMEGSKGSLQEGGIKVPMIVRWPGKSPAGTVDDTPWYFADFLPTAAELAGAEAPEAIDGVSVVPTLLGREQDLSERWMYWESSPLKPEGSIRQAARRGDFKALRWSYGGEINQIYNLAVDPYEKNNVKNEHPELAAEFAEFMDQAHVYSPYWPHSGQDPGGSAAAE